MRRRILDTQILIRHWLDRLAKTVGEADEQDAASWAAGLVQTYSTDKIVGPLIGWQQPAEPVRQHNRGEQ